MIDGPRKQRGKQPDPVRRPAPGVGKLRENLLSGHGSPEGSVHAGAGTVWQDTDPAGTGQVYKKSTPSGNTGWVELTGGGGGGGGGGSLANRWHIQGGRLVIGSGTPSAGYDVLRARDINDVLLDTAGGYDVLSGLYTAPAEGWYWVYMVFGGRTLSGICTVEMGFQAYDLSSPPSAGIDYVLERHDFDSSNPVRLEFTATQLFIPAGGGVRATVNLSANFRLNTSNPTLVFGGYQVG